MDLLKIAQENQDAAKRISETVNLHLVVARDILEEAVGQWAAFRLDDGRSDGSLYPTKDDCIRHQKGNPHDYCYMKITPDGISVKDAWGFLRINRHPMIDTTAPEHVINPHLFPRFSNLTPAQRRELKQRAEDQYRADRNR